MPLALDPSVFSDVFGNVSSVKPSVEQLNELEGIAQSKNQSILSTVEKCRNAGDKCVLEKEGNE
ncbi:hypothetical protein [Photobacterium galatheae]|uniref:Uncharacterized protein n=1 Tax=Photobacterium galatheae TaxID=1654360 RepID=A0A066RLF7_9GAMM|nr:hypothetical protein [Photobacterium galatheae]KDM91275.1 hypothetical protein EA58_11925 [Photobacterium galatheae]MCM0150324.1 hypothetical protein [Photobacterium galatheae]